MSFRSPALRAGLALSLLLVLDTPTALAQGPGILASQSSFQRVYAIVPMIGKGSYDDPIRPMFVPANGFKQNMPSLLDRGPVARSGIISYSYQQSDDGKSALVEFVSVDRAGLREILESKTPGVVAFERGKHDRSVVDAAFKAKKKDFDFEKFSMNKVR